MRIISFNINGIKSMTNKLKNGEKKERGDRPGTDFEGKFRRKEGAGQYVKEGEKKRERGGWGWSKDEKRGGGGIALTSGERACVCVRWCVGVCALPSRPPGRRVGTGCGKGYALNPGVAASPSIAFPGARARPPAIHHHQNAIGHL